MLALCMSLSFDCFWVFLWWVLHCSWLTEGHSVHHVLYAVVQVLPEQNHKAHDRNPHQQRNHQQITMEEGEGGSGSHTNLNTGLIWKDN